MRGRFGPAREQGGRQTCLAFATSDAHAAAIGQPWTELCCEYLFDHAKQTALPRTKAPRSRRSEQPWSMTASRSRRSGPTYLPALPTDLRQWKPPAKVKALFRRKSKRKQTGFGEVWAAVEAYSPTVVGMTLSPAFSVPTAEGVVDADELVDRAVKHAVLAVATGKLGRKKLILVRNGWGDTWGLSGYAWLSERYMSPRILVAMTLH